MTAPASPYLSEGAVLAGRYAVGRELGRGGFSVVYLARDQALDSDVAIKLLVPPPAAAALARERAAAYLERDVAGESCVVIGDTPADVACGLSIGARIIAVVDAYDAMAVDRIYRKALGHEFAIRELRRCAGTQFDPAVVEAFLSIVMFPGSGPSATDSERGGAGMYHPN